jgi:acyl-CoA synthetase (AMP-forming)/AMP-acid ligase II
MKSVSASVAAALEGAVTAQPEASALSHGGAQLSYGELWREVRKTARAFVAHGIRAGQRVASWSPATLESLCVQWAALLCGATLVHLDLELEEEHTRAILDAEQPTHVFVRASFEGRQFPAILRAMRGELSCDPRVVVHGRTARFERVLPGGWAEFVDHAAAVSDDDLREREAAVIAGEHEGAVGICYGPQGTIELVQAHHVLEAQVASRPSLCARTSLADPAALRGAFATLVRGSSLTLAYAAAESAPRPSREHMPGLAGGPRLIEA